MHERRGGVTWCVWCMYGGMYGVCCIQGVVYAAHAFLPTGVPTGVPLLIGVHSLYLDVLVCVEIEDGAIEIQTYQIHYALVVVACVVQSTA